MSRERKKEVKKVSLSKELKVSFLFLAIGLCALTIYVKSTMDPSRILHILASANIPYFFISLSIGVLGLLCYGLTWHLLVRGAGIKTSLNYNMLLALSSVFFNIVIPSATVSGEAYRIYMASRTKVESEKWIATVALHRIFCLMPFTFALSIGLAIAIVTGQIPNNLIRPFTLSTIAFIMVLILLLTFVFNASLTAKLVSFLLKIPVKALRSKIENKKHSLEEKIEVFSKTLLEIRRKRKVFLASILLAFLYWFFDSFILFFVLISLGVQVSIFLIVFIYTLTVLLQTIPLLIPGMLGVVDVMRTELLYLNGINREIALTGSILTDVIMVFFFSVIGFLSSFLFTLKYSSKQAV